MKFFFFLIYKVFFLSFFLPSLISSQKCSNLTLCGLHGKCMYGNCICDVYFYGMNCENELNTTKKVTFIETGIKYDVIPIFVTTFLLGIPLLYVLGMFCLKLIINPKIKENPKIFDFQSLNASIPNQIFRENEQSFINPIIENRPNNNANVNDELNSQNRIISNPSEFINKNENSDLIKRNSLTTQKFEMIGAINFNPPLIPTEFNNSKKKLIPFGGSKKTVSFESQKSKGINEEENGTLLENLELTKLKSFKERVEVNAFYSKEVHEFVNMNDTIPDILEFLEKSLDKYLLKM